MRIFLDCVPCFIRQALDAIRLVNNDDELIQEQVLRDILRLTVDMDMRQTPPAIARQIHRLIRRITKNKDPYFELKQKNNKLALKISANYVENITKSEDPLETALRLAIAGNIIDLGVKTSISESEIKGTIENCLKENIDRHQFEDFKASLEGADRILYLTDNAGEIVFDRLLIEQLPLKKVTVAVKGKPVINDATMKDAEFAGLTEIVDVIDNGHDAPGTILIKCSETFLKHFDESDMIIAKGQGNYETLSDVKKNIFFLLKVKCPVIAKDLNAEVGEMILKRSENFNENTDLPKEVG